MMQALGMVAGRARRSLTQQYNPAAAFAPVSDAMLVALSMQHSTGGACSSHSDLTQQLQSSGVLRSEAVRAAFAAVDRARFVPAEVRDPRIIYADRAVRCGRSGSLCSPSMQVVVLELIQDAVVGVGRHALDIGTGTGSMAVLMAEMGARVDAIDIDPDVIAVASERHRHRRICWRRQDALQMGAAGAYDCIHVGASVDFVPEAWLAMLNVGGIMVVPIGRPDSEQTLMKLTKTADLLDGRHVVLRDAVQACKYEPMRSETVRPGMASADEAYRAHVKQELQSWWDAFKSRRGRKPNLDDMRSDGRVSELLSRYRQQSTPIQR